MAIFETEKLKEIINNPGKCVIFPHRNPDGDALGSTLTLKSILDQKGMETALLSPTTVAGFLHWMPGYDQVIQFHSNNEDQLRMLNDADYYFFLDFNDVGRIEEIEPYLNTSAKRVMIDHHEDPKKFDVNISQPHIASTCELLYMVLQDIKLDNLIGENEATNLYVGIMTDTGSFKYSSTTPQTHRIVADLIEKGANNAEIHRKIYDTNSLSRLQLLGKMLNNFEYLEKQHTSILSLSKREMMKSHYQDGDSEGFVNYGLSLSDAVCSAFFKEDKDRIKISFRSKGDFEVNVLAKEHFQGGGHKNAAGGVSFDTLENTIKKFKKIIPEYYNQIHKVYEQL